MNNYEIITDFHIQLNTDTVLTLIDCYPGSPIYEEVMEEYQGIVERVMQTIEPKVIIKYGKLSCELAARMGGKEAAGAPVLFVLITIGDEVAELSSYYFDEGDYLLGMLSNAIADTYLFQMDDALQDIIKKSCNDKDYKIEKRYDAPLNIPMQIQKDILVEIKEIVDLPIDVTEGYMYTTVKTMGYILMLTNNQVSDYVGHNCMICSQLNCKLRKN